MKINKLFHWLYALVMFLPLFVLPIFALAVRSDNNYQPIEVQQELVEVVNFNQLKENGNFKNTSGPYYYSTGNFLDVSYNDYFYGKKVYDLGCSLSFVDFAPLIVPNHKLYFKFNAKISISDNNITSVLRGSGNGTEDYYGSFVFTDTFDSYDIIIQFPRNNYNVVGFVFGWNAYLPADTEIWIKDINCFDLTYMFGSGNEPSIQQFNIWYSDNYYDFNTGDKQLLKTGLFDTLNDTDFGSQTIYTLYKEVDTYFNYDNVFNFGYLYDWLQLNIFNGYAPLGFFIFWHLLIYWLLTSLLWLLFDVLMYVPQLIHRWLDKASLS